MYVRRVKSKQRGKVYESIQIVESARDPVTRSPRTRIIAHLGQVSSLKDKDIDNIINGLCKAVGRPVAGDVHLDYAHDFGHIWAIIQIWKALKIGCILEEQARRSGVSFDLAQHICLMTANRLCDPRSKLGLLAWLEGVYFPGIERKNIEYHHLLRAMDWLISHKEHIEKQVAQRYIDMFNRNCLDLVFYDITSTYFEGDHCVAADEIRAHRYSRDHRPDRRQVVIGVVVTPEGIPLCHHVFTGNTADKSTVADVVRDLKQRFGIKRVVFVGDRGMLSDSNIETLLNEQFGFIVAHSLRQNNTVREFITDTHGQLDQDPATDQQFVEARREGCKFVMAYDPAAAAQGKKHRDEALARADEFIRDVKRRQKRSAVGKQRGRPLTAQGALFQIRDYLKKRGLHRYYTLSLNGPASMDVRKNRTSVHWEGLIDGKLVVETSELTLCPEDVIARYKQLQTIERGFRSLKSSLKLRPVYHWTQRRIRAHIFICVLALLLDRHMHQSLSALSISANTAIEKLRQIKAGCIRSNGSPTAVLTSMGEQHRNIYRQLEIPFPKIKDIEAL